MIFVLVLLMNRYLYIIVLSFLASVRLSLCAQESVMPRRTAEELAMKRTEMLIRELDIRDSMLRDTLYRVHLRYARSREDAGNRQEAVERMNRLMGELKGILTPMQYERLLAIPHQRGARMPRAEKDSLCQDATPATP